MNKLRMEKDKNNHLNTTSVDDKNYIVFIRVLSDFLAGNTSNTVGEVDWNQIARLSRMHGVEGIVFQQCGASMPSDIRSSFEKTFYSTLFYYKNREKMMFEIAKEFMDNEIPFFEVKGMEVARYYPLPSLRTMGDSDIVVHKEDREKAISILLGMGFVYDHEYTGKERVYYRNGLNIELHHSLIYDEVINVPEQEFFFSKCWDYVNDGELDNSFHFLFLISHLRKHMLNSGAGFRQFMDIAAAAKNDSELNWKWIEEKLSEIKLRRFAQTCYGLIDEWFGISIPTDYPKLDQDFIILATNKVMNNGVFGFDDKSNRRNTMTNQMRKFNGPRWLFRISTLCKRMFPGYSFFRVSEEFKFLDGRPWLLPIAWYRRFCLRLKERPAVAGELLGQIMTPDSVVDLREEELKRWGLIE